MFKALDGFRLGPEVYLVYQLCFARCADSPAKAPRWRSPHFVSAKMAFPGTNNLRQLPYILGLDICHETGSEHILLCPPDVRQLVVASLNAGGGGGNFSATKRVSEGLGERRATSILLGTRRSVSLLQMHRSFFFCIPASNCSSNHIKSYKPEYSTCCVFCLQTLKALFMIGQNPKPVLAGSTRQQVRIIPQ